jgi:hypothetical protein
VFNAEESSTDYHQTFIEHFPISICNSTIFAFRVTQGLETFEIKIYPNGAETMYNDYVCLTIQLLTSQQTAIGLSAAFSIKTCGGAWIWLREVVPTLSLSNESPQLFNLTLLSKVMNKANRMLNDDGIFTIRMIGSYLIHTQHTIASLKTKFNDKIHTRVDMSYIWTVCNLTLPLVDITQIVSNTFFGGLGVAKFYIIMYPGTISEHFISIYSYLLSIAHSLKLPLQVNQTFELVNSTSSKQAVVYERKGQGFGSPQYFKYSNLVKSMQQQCVTFKHRIEYAVYKENINL